MAEQIYGVTEGTKKRIERVLRWFETERIEQVQQSGGGKPDPVRAAAMLVKVTTAASGYGKYNGKKLARPTVPLNATSNLLENMMGNPSSLEDCVIFNAAESSQSTHDLTAGTPKSTVFVGIVIGSTDQGKPVVVINGNDWFDCT